MQSEDLINSEAEERDEIAEKALEDLYSGLSLSEAAKKQSLHKTTLVRHLVSNPTYEQRYARALVSKGVIFAEEIVSIPDALPDEPTPGELAKAKMRMEARQWTATKFWQHLSPERVAQAGVASVNIQANGDSRIVIQTASDVPATETQSQEALDVEAQQVK
jgi:hypothetical protein